MVAHWIYCEHCQLGDLGFSRFALVELAFGSVIKSNLWKK